MGTRFVFNLALSMSDHQSGDGVLDVQLRLPKEMGGQEVGTNPEQLFAVGDVSIDSRVSLLPTEEHGFKLAVELDAPCRRSRIPSRHCGSWPQPTRCAHARTPREETSTSS
jgi:hypothetical protein